MWGKKATTCVNQAPCPLPTSKQDPHLGPWQMAIPLIGSVPVCLSQAI